MADPVPPDVRDIFDKAWESAQRMAMDVIEFPDAKRDAAMRRMGMILTEIASEAGCPHEMAREFGDTMEQTIRAYVAEIEARGGGITGTA
jgi:phytoene/squalene synthetase